MKLPRQGCELLTFLGNFSFLINTFPFLSSHWALRFASTFCPRNLFSSKHSYLCCLLFSICDVYYPPPALLPACQINSNFLLFSFLFSFYHNVHAILNFSRDQPTKEKQGIFPNYPNNEHFISETHPKVHFPVQ